MMLTVLEGFFQKHEDLFMASQPTPTVWVSVSGGADSMVLLDTLRRYQRAHPSLFHLEVLHFNFGLRGKESLRDEVLVRSYCEQYGLSFLCKKAEGAPVKGRQTWARQWRLNTLRESPVTIVFEAHHQDDLVETFLFRLLRGSGLKGLAAMQERSEREGKIILRPFLSVSKAELLHTAESEKIPFIHDSSNAETTYSRNWLRHEIIPRLNERFPAASEKMAALSREIRDTEELHERELEADLELISSRMESLSGARGQEWLWPRREMQMLDTVLLKRVIRELLWKDFQMTLDREKTDDLVIKIKAQEAFCVNAPRDLQIRSRGGKAPIVLRFLSKSTIQESTL